MLLALAVVAITSSAEQPEQPESPALHFEQPVDAKLDHVSVVHHVGIDHVKTSVTFTLTVDTATPHDVALAIDVPRDAAVVGMKLALGELVSTAALDWSDGARKTYNAIVERDRDPALLEWIDTTETHQQLRLRVFPVTPATPATVTITFVTPRPMAVESAAWLAVAQRTVTTAFPRPALGFGRQLGRRMSLIATDLGARLPGWNNVGF